VERQLPKNIIAIRRTQNQKELAEIYTAADVFVNPTREDNFPTVNMETIACGTPVITFDTGGSPETLDEHCGCVVEKDNVDAIIQKIGMLDNRQKSCRERAEEFDEQRRFLEITALYTV